MARSASHPTGKTLAVGQLRGVKLYDSETGHERAELLSEDAYECFGLSFSADGRRLAAATGMGYVIVWDTETGRSLSLLKAHTRSLEGVSLSPDGKWAASASDGPIICHSIEAASLVSDQGEWPAGRILASSGSSTWPRDRSKRRSSTRGRLDSVSFSPDGKLLLRGAGAQPSSGTVPRARSAQSSMPETGSSVA